MNARQKAKKYRKELEVLKNKTVERPFINEPCRITVLKTSLVIRDEAEIACMTPLKEYIEKELARQFAEDEDFRQVLLYETRPDPFSLSKIYTAELRVLLN